MILSMVTRTRTKRIKTSKSIGNGCILAEIQVRSNPQALWRVKPLDWELAGKRYCPIQLIWVDNPLKNARNKGSILPEVQTKMTNHQSRVCLLSSTRMIIVRDFKKVIALVVPSRVRIQAVAKMLSISSNQNILKGLKAHPCITLVPRRLPSNPETKLKLQAKWEMA